MHRTTADRLPTIDAERSARVLYVATVVVGALTAALVGLLTWSPLVAVVAVIPPGLALLPVLLPRAYRGRVALALAVLFTAAAVLAGAEMGALYGPFVAQAWAAALVPWGISRGFDLGKLVWWRVGFSVVFALPVFALLMGVFNNSLGIAIVGGLVVLVLALLAVAVAGGVRLAAPILAAIGLVSMLLALFDRGLLLLGVWWGGGVYLVLGLAAWVAWSPRKDAVPGSSES